MTMKEVLAAHQWISASPYPAERCTCGIFPAAQTNKAMATHQASVLAANGYGKLEDAWDAGYGADNESWPDCAIPCGACEQCQKEPTANPYRRPE